METLKPVTEILQPDERNLLFVRLDTGKPLTLDEHHAEVAAIELNPDVPEDVRSYFNTIRNVCVYAWFSYYFYAVVAFLSFTAIEMALRKRFPIEGKDKRGLRDLLREAIGRGLIQDKGFTHIKLMREYQARELRMFRRMTKIPRSSVPKSNYRQVLLETLPWLRNMFAHPRSHTIQMPGDALFQLRVTAEFINQLFAAPESK